jgi:hypothetical protein
MERIPSDKEWVNSRVAGLPFRWAKRLERKWNADKAKDYFSANVRLRKCTDSLLQVRIPLDASDTDICDAAAALAERCADRLTLYLTSETLRASMARICAGQGIQPPPDTVRDGPAIARMCCPIWWRRKLRKHQGQIVEAAAINLGYVAKHRDLYVSKERLMARTQQVARNSAALEATIARNEDGEEFSLAELAAKSTSNKAIRRAELMTRISGFERYALAEDHAGIFITITCPSRFHRWTSVNGGKTHIENKNYDEAENPKTGQAYLAKVWTRIRAKLARLEIGIYGFRIAEPQHDGTPHWHLLLFCLPEHIAQLQEVTRAHALKDSPDEPGAAEHRCDFKMIDRSKGSAAGYIIKYVAKNIDGNGVGLDLNGKPATETALRVDAWASTWGIRQFQQVGGAPVGVWRELRRIAAIPAAAPEHLKDAHLAANKATQIEGKEGDSVAWDRYCRAQGGAFCGRKARIQLAMREPDSLGTYGDGASLRPYGVTTFAIECASDTASPSAMALCFVPWTIESTRRKWEIVSPNKHKTSPLSVVPEQVELAQPRTSVNNCTSLTEYCRLRAGRQIEYKYISSI